MITALLQYNFLQNALIGALLASLACGIIGPIIVEKRLLMMSGGIAHTAFGGIGLGYYLQVEPMYTALGFSLFSSLSIAQIQRRSTVMPDVLIGMFWPLGMALGILFISFTPGYPPSMSTYLFGDILTVSRSDLWVMALLDALLLFISISFFHLLQAYLFDEEFSDALGLPMVLAEALTYAMIALTVVVLIRVVGIILILALLCVPPALARIFRNDLPSIMGLSVILGAILCLAGLVISYHYNLASGAAIVILSVAAYCLVHLLTQPVKLYLRHMHGTLETSDNSAHNIKR
ncbi:MAG: metal ABC transporter permease [Syntrophomonas sp.]|uniref:metal ABC transporter permease n=1 Tax=Syntrophomonas sp. TaxID=2053627 RepID=UPI00262276FE|nr:metal ABC transporter permease [Syntrophomonas sp.]MDD2510931.1 metal ABC transporter permease [Syntrophomonas sp.]MDD3879691.1 metal ABC transporter permease [Syntrophomonas sp.]MDD4626895.1 metal ABC transporter permease [Syntrophomonas sp.]